MCIAPGKPLLRRVATSCAVAIALLVATAAFAQTEPSAPDAPPPEQPSGGAGDSSAPSPADQPTAAPAPQLPPPLPPAATAPEPQPAPQQAAPSHGAAVPEGAEGHAPSPQPAPASSDTSLDQPTERRGGFVMGLIAAPVVGWATGNPNDRSKRENPAYETSTGSSFGYRATPFIGGALTDWFSFGLGISFGSISRAKYRSDVTTFVFRLETFPLYSEGGVYRDLGLSADFGAGASTIRRKSDDEKVASSGAMSTVGVGAFWEPLRFWQLAAGPYLGYQHNWSRWFSRHDVAAGVRVMFYGAP